MDKAGNSAGLCAVCLGALKEECNDGFPYYLLPAFIRKILVGYDSVVVLKPCSHKFHLTCINECLSHSQRCPLDRRLITGSDSPKLLSINLPQVLFNAIKNNRIEDVREILLTGLTPEQLSCPDQWNPLTMASVTDRWEIAVQLIRAGWTTDDNVALYNLGTMYCEGQVVEQDWVKARICYRKAADQGDAPAQKRLGRMYQLGQGVKQDRTEALLWYLMAANQGYAAAQEQLGWMYQYGDGVEQDYTEALFWYRRAANQGDAWAEKNLGLMYEEGLGVKQDYTEALSWYRKAAEQGNASAQNSMGWMKERALGVEQD